MSELIQSPGGSVGAPAISGNWYDVACALGTNGAPTSSAMAANTLYAQPFLSTAKNGYDRIGVGISAAAVAGSLCRCSLYSVGADGKPGSLIVDSGALAADAIADVAATIALNLPLGTWGWTIFCTNGAPSSYRYSGNLIIPGLGWTAPSDATRVSFMSASLAFGAMPASLVGVTWTRGTSPAAVRLRAV